MKLKRSRKKIKRDTALFALFLSIILLLFNFALFASISYAIQYPYGDIEAKSVSLKESGW